MAFPIDCASDTFCAVAQSLLARLMLRGTIKLADSFAIFAGVSDVKIGSGLIISNAGFEIQAGAETSAGITGYIVLADPQYEWSGSRDDSDWMLR